MGDNDQPDVLAETLDGVDEASPFGPRYRVLATLGRGGMGAVYKVWDAELDEVIALKVLLPELAEDRRAALRLRREVKLARRVTHPNVARVFDLQVHNDALYITMEFVAGRSLEDDVEPPSATRVVELARQICEGLQAAHDVGVVHRDLKPDNVMLTTDGVVKLADFGIAAIALEDTGGEIVGTPHYVAPEQARGESVDGRADIYALGVMMWEMLVGEPPWQADTTMKVIMRRLVEPPRPLPPQCAPPRLRRIVMTCLAREPEDRFATAAAVARALDALKDVAETTAIEPLQAAGNLPTRVNTFVGREDELQEIRRRMAGGERLLTLLGPGGTGKTRLALEAGRATTGDIGSIWFIDLSAAVTRDELVDSVCRVLDVPAGEERLGRALRARGRTMLILDNVEQAVAPAAALLGDWLVDIPELQILATSRARLGVAAEQVFAVEPLATRRAMELFEQRARMVRRDYQVGDAHETVRQIVERIDRLPLAIEIVAAQMRLLDEEQLLSRLDDRFRSLRDRSRDRPERHMTMESVLDGSWQLLSPGAQQTLAQLSVFRGGAPLEIACEVLDVTEGDQWPEELIEELWDHSLLRFIDDRIELLALVREYAARQLQDPEPVFLRHGVAMASLATRLRSGSARDRAQLVREHANLHLACSRAIERGDTDTIYDTLDGLTVIYRMHGNPDLTLYERALNSADDTAWQYRVALMYAGGLIHFGRDEEARVLLTPAADPSNELDARTRALANKTLGEIASRGGDLARAREFERELLRLAAEVDDPSLQSDAWVTKGTNHWTRAEFRDAQAAYERALSFTTNEVAIGRLHGMLGLVHADLGDLQIAADYFRRAVDVHRRSANLIQEALMLTNLGRTLSELGDLEAALTCWEEALRIHENTGDLRWTSLVHLNLGSAKHRDPAVALGHLHKALDGFRVLGERRYEAISQGQMALYEAHTGAFEAAESNFDEAEAVLRSVDDSFSLGRLLTKRGEACVLAENHADARLYLAEARALLAQTSAKPESALAMRVRSLADMVEKD